MLTAASCKMPCERKAGDTNVAIHGSYPFIAFRNDFCVFYFFEFTKRIESPL